MPSPRNNQRPLSSIHIAILATLLVALVSGGCARKPWGDPFQEDAFEAAKAEISGFIEGAQTCGDTVATDLSIFYDDPLGRKAMKGYLEFSLPKSFKFIVTNPFGQPLLAVSANTKTFEVIITRDSQFIAGSLESYALRHDLPVEFVQGDWGAWFTGRSLNSASDIQEIREDLEGRGLWVKFRSNSPVEGPGSVLFDRESGAPLIRFIENKQGKKIATITYRSWTKIDDSCSQPAEIEVSDLGYGTTIKLELSEIEIRPERNVYDLTPPTGFFQQYLP